MDHLQTTAKLLLLHRGESTWHSCSACSEDLSQSILMLSKCILMAKDCTFIITFLWALPPQSTCALRPPRTQAHTHSTQKPDSTFSDKSSLFGSKVQQKNPNIFSLEISKSVISQWYFINILLNRQLFIPTQNVSELKHFGQVFEVCLGLGKSTKTTKGNHWDVNPYH